MIIINKIDAENVDLPGCSPRSRRRSARSACRSTCRPAAAGKSSTASSIRAGDADFSSVEEAHQRARRPGGRSRRRADGDLPRDRAKSPRGNCTRRSSKRCAKAISMPMCFVSARNGAGVTELLDIFVKLMPNPDRRQPAAVLSRAKATEAQPISAEPDPEEARARARLQGRWSIRSSARSRRFPRAPGHDHADTQLFIGDGRKPFKVAHLYLLRGKDFVEIDALVPGDIGAVAKVEEIALRRGAARFARRGSHPLRAARVPGADAQPRDRAQAPRRRAADVRSPAQALPPRIRTFRVEHNREQRDRHERTGRPAHALHPRPHAGAVPRRSRDQAACAFRTARPLPPRPKATIATRNRPAARASSAKCSCEVEPLARGTGFEFVDQVKGGTIPSAIHSGGGKRRARKCSTTGPLAGYPVQDVRVIVYDGKHHPVDSKEVAFIIGGQASVHRRDRQGARRSCSSPSSTSRSPRPRPNMGDIAGDISSRSAARSAAPTRSGRARSLINGKVPLSELNNYQARLKSVTAGQGSYAMELSHYEPGAAHRAEGSHGGAREDGAGRGRIMRDRW